MIEIILRAHRERDGQHRDRFEAYLGDQLLCVSRSGWHDPARRLLELGHDPDELMVVRHAGRAHDPTIVGKPIGALAKWTFIEIDRAGIRKIRWRDPRERTDLPGKVLPGVQDGRCPVPGYGYATATAERALELDRAR